MLLLRIDKSLSIEIRMNLSLDVNLNTNSRFHNKYMLLSVRARKQREMVEKREGRTNEKTQRRLG